MVPRYQTPEMARLWSEENRYRTWALVEAYALEAWEALGQVPKGLSARLLDKLAEKPLDRAFAQRVAELEEVTRHDLVAFTRALTEWTGDEEVGRYLHLGLTSSDVVDTAQNALLVEALDLIGEELQGVREALKGLALRYKHTPAIARTHGVHAEPTSFGLRFLSFYAAFGRDEERLRRAKEAIGVAMLSGSVGNYAHVPPEVEAHVARRLGLVPEPISTQVVPRDRHAEVLAALALLGGNLERVAVELRHLQRTEVLEAQEPFREGQTGSSSMPHKKNPVGLENLTGMARLLRGYLQPALENIALWHERDISHSSVERVVLPDATTAAHYALRRLRGILEGLVVLEANLERNLGLTRGLVYSQQVLNALIAQGLPRDRAYALVQRNALKSFEEGRDFRELLEMDPENPLKGEALGALFSPQAFLRHVDAIYARFGL
ncbi:MAG: adenylosuccinate lyase [Thermus sp.]|uniref:adenylosuccinate lyase n=1 Tax=Thermus sp. TaxID=275 RepID=UPI0025E51388|nr:adenylosuccinate lyase [Thermus sp.]MCS7218424.1 adenylosuccinate lyase [Thermus sp.]MCX7849254.1 adenylosuccinate lyase [Thermus sp.]MDW8356972.1 adenylosuccinate lyase [Thermus sp.]